METSEYQPLEYRERAYRFGGVNLLELLADDNPEHKTPCYVYDLGIVKRQASKLLAAIPWENKHFLYAMKQDFNPYILRAVHDLGYGIDAVSINEVVWSMECGVRPDEILFTENNISDDEMDRAVQLGIRLNIDSLSRLEKYGKKYPGTKVFVRINPEIIADTLEHWQTAGPDSKFGTHPKQIKEILEKAQENQLIIAGIHEHIGTSILKPEQLIQAMKALLAIAPQFPDLEALDFGGGIGTLYDPDTQKEIDIEAFGKEATTIFDQFCKQYGKELTFMMEPGRYICAQAGILLATVTTIKRNPDGQIFVGLDTGYNHLVRPMTYGSYHRIINLSRSNGPKERCHFVGQICESGDKLGLDRNINVKEGDVVAIMDTGASGMSMANNYNMRCLPPEIVIENGQVYLSRARQTYDDIVAPYRKQMGQRLKTSIT